MRGVCYARKIDKAEARIDWSAEAPLVARRIRAFNPAPGATGRLCGEDVKLWQAQVGYGGAEVLGDAGRVLAATPQGIQVACSTGAVWITALQRAGGKRLTAAQFVQGRAPLAGERFEIAQS